MCVCTPTCCDLSPPPRTLTHSHTLSFTLTHTPLSPHPISPCLSSWCTGVRTRYDFDAGRRVFNFLVCEVQCTQFYEQYGENPNLCGSTFCLLVAQQEEPIPCMRNHACVLACVCMCMCVRACMCVHVCVCVCVCVCVVLCCVVLCLSCVCLGLVLFMLCMLVHACVFCV